MNEVYSQDILLAWIFLGGRKVSQRRGIFLNCVPDLFDGERSEFGDVTHHLDLGHLECLFLAGEESTDIVVCDVLELREVESTLAE